MNLRAEFERFCNDAYTADINGSGSTRDFEHHLVSLLEFVVRHMSEHREELVSCFVALALDEIQAPPEALAFCMHTLRLPEVLDALCKKRDSTPSESRAHYDWSKYLADVRESYADDWKHADLWAYYRDDKSN